MTVQTLGLTTAEAARALARSGPNSLPAKTAERLWRKVFRALTDPLVLVLMAAVGLTLLTWDLADTAVIGLVVVVNTVVAVRQEVGADRAVAALRSLAAPHCRVVRDGVEQVLAVDQVVPGDVVLLADGDLVPADGRVLDAVALRVNEATLTGESVPVDKHPSTSTDDPDPEAHVLSGTAVVHGRGRVEVERTGPDSALGQIASLLGGGHVATPLQRRMARLSLLLAAAAVGLCAVVLVTGWARGQSLELMMLAAISLAVAAVPESLPAVVTISLSLAARRMARRNAVVRDLAAVETLGSVTLLATDKTGTLTQARMAVVDHWTAPGVDPADLQRAAVLCSDASTADPGGDPTEVALLTLCSPDEVEPLRSAYPRVGELPFDSDRKRMATRHVRPGGGRLTVCKGAPERVLAGSVVATTEAVRRGRVGPSRARCRPPASASSPWPTAVTRPRSTSRTRPGSGCSGWSPSPTRRGTAPEPPWTPAGPPASG